ncbi:hypothetical protein [Acetonema longum]|uniref:ECF transporter S component n=1 Tax=Acetonema longum DSM 6540 TaxID=1009370 RepID=F7NQ76_9FIRM|nr:hypothetical protein [Acetonema longum]EGO61835.1 hypothetical protein ALO_21384 [Acetonema longum DSM 6540]
MAYRILTRTALLLALALLFQSLRFYLPVPVFFSTVLIGTLVNATIIVAVRTAGVWPGMIVGVLTPVVAYFQQLLLLPLFIIPVAVGNMIYAGSFYKIFRRGNLPAVIIAAMLKAASLYFAFAWLVPLTGLAAKQAAMIIFVMSWPQLVTAIAGGLLALVIGRRIRQFHS